MEAKPLVWWNVHRDEIDMDPPYQRKGNIWSTDKKAYLIDSILNEFDIPKFYIADFNYGNSILNNKNVPYAIIDGKQRFQAIFQYFNNEYKTSSTIQFLKDPTQNITGLSYSELKTNFPSVAEIFDSYNLSVMSVLTDSDRLINDLFLRLNSSQVTLTGAEIRNAMPGEAVRKIQEISNHVFFKRNISFSTKRRSEFDVASKILLFEYAGKPVATKKVNLDEFVLNSIKSKEGINKIRIGKQSARTTLDMMHEVFLSRDKLLNSSNVLPVYYWFIRNIKQPSLGSVRGFLENVEIIRRFQFKHGLRLEIDLDFILEIMEYSNYFSRLNDSTSNEGRYKILVKWFDERKGLIELVAQEIDKGNFDLDDEP